MGALIAFIKTERVWMPTSDGPPAYHSRTARAARSRLAVADFPSVVPSRQSWHYASGSWQTAVVNLVNPSSDPW